MDSITVTAAAEPGSWCFGTAVASLKTRQYLWENICNIAGTMDKPWALLGDFNTCKTVDEKKGGKPLKPCDIRDFNECLVEAGLGDLTAT
ncbi:hypothetical protein FRX31_028056, partial [Thalictrum thalictroides]